MVTFTMSKLDAEGVTNQVRAWIQGLPDVFVGSFVGLTRSSYPELIPRAHPELMPIIYARNYR